MTQSEKYVVTYHGVSVHRKSFDDVDDAVKFINRLPAGDFVEANTVVTTQLDIPRRRIRRVHDAG